MASCIGDKTSIEQNCHIVAGGKLEIGRDVTVSANVYISDCGHGIDDMETDVMCQPLFVKKTKIDNEAFLGIGSRIMPGVSIGSHSVIGANAVVTKNIPDYSMAIGLPARVVKKYDLGKKSGGKHENISDRR